MWCLIDTNMLWKYPSMNQNICCWWSCLGIGCHIFLIPYWHNPHSLNIKHISIFGHLILCIHSHRCHQTLLQLNSHVVHWHSSLVGPIFDLSPWKVYYPVAIQRIWFGKGQRRSGIYNSDIHFSNRMFLTFLNIFDILMISWMYFLFLLLHFDYMPSAWHIHLWYHALEINRCESFVLFF